MADKKILNVKVPTIVDSYYEDEDFKKELDKVSNDILINAETTRTINNIKKTLASALKKKYGFSNGELKELTTKILKIHGLDVSNFDVLSSFGKIMEERVNDVSIDDNSNKNEKTVAGVNNEITASFRKLIGYHMLYGVMKDLYGQAEAKVLSGDLYDLSLGLSDSTNILIPYCWALDSSKLVLEGRKFGQLPSGPVHRLDSYVAALCETVHQMSSHLAGAIAEGTFFLDFAHILMYKERVPFEKIKSDEKVRDRIVQNYQKFIHHINHLSRNGVESPFTNISVFDKVKLAGLIGKDNYGWYFANKKDIALDNGLEDKMDSKQWEEFVINYIIELQKLYVEFHEKGDPLNNGIPYRFPVTTINLSKNDDKELLDKEFLDYVCQRDITRFNIFSSKGTKVASCCRLINDSELLDLGSSVNSFGGTSISMGSHRVVTINFARIAYESKSVDDFFKILDKRIRNAAKVLKAHKVLLGKMEEKGLEPFITRGWIRMDRLFSTFGILGVVEAKKILEIKFPEQIKENQDVMKDFLVYLNEYSQKYAKELGLFSNIEQIPGESFAVRLATVDNLIYPNENIIDAPLYANQFVPLWEEATIWEKMDADGKYNQLLTGGGIVHCQLGSKTTPSQNKKIIEYAVKSGCEHFALNSVFSKCPECDTVYDHKVESCSKCGHNGDMRYYSRIVGFFTPVDSWNPTRRNWEFQRRTFVDDSLHN